MSGLGHGTFTVPNASINGDKATVLKGIVPRYKGWLPANEAGRAHAVNEHGAWRIAGKFARVDSNQHVVSFPDPTTHVRGKGLGTLAPILGSASLTIMWLFA